MSAIRNKIEDATKIDFSAQFSRIQFLKGDLKSSLPSWAKFFLELGASLAGFEAEQLRYVAAIALPSRAYAVPFLGGGYSFAHFLLHEDMNIEHIEQIRGLPNGTPVRYLDGKGRLKKAIKRNLISYEGKELVGIQDEGEGNKTVYLPPNKISRVEVSDEQYKRLPNHQKGRRIRPPSSLLGALLVERSIEYIFQTKIYGVVVGSLSSMKLESQAELLLRSETEPSCRGFLQELFRLEGTNPAHTGHRFSMHHVNSFGPPIGKVLQTNPVAIFDGSLSFMKWKEQYRTHNWIIILDRTEPNFPVAVSQVNNEYANRSDQEPKIPSPPVPQGVEVMLFSRDI